MNATEGRVPHGALRDFVLRPSRAVAGTTPWLSGPQRLRPAAMEILRLVGIGYAVSLLLLLPAGAASLALHLSVAKSNLLMQSPLLRSPLALLLIALAATLEECVFRGFLSARRFGVALLWMALPFFAVLMATRLLDFTPNLLQRLLAFTAAFAVGYLAWPLYGRATAAFIERHFRGLVWLSALVFGLAHISNYQSDALSPWWIHPLFVLPQMGLGLLLAYVRTRHGLPGSILVHFLFDALLVLLMVTKAQHWTLLAVPLGLLVFGLLLWGLGTLALEIFGPAPKPEGPA
ncbi:MAG: CPBP family intramembrane metalloprotease [Xanthomonadaceae bacterium]|nr:CPBP family intramembrane metalloprotease [Xanthomonadaceae bacterium]MDE2246893.1 CPBP family intramembrane metalloprotease [Xanthomonadaceae bacterium]